MISRLFRFLGAILAALLFTGAGAYVLWQFHTTAGLVAGLACLVLAVAIALPVPFHAGVNTVKENWAELKPAVSDLLSGRRDK